MSIDLLTAFIIAIIILVAYQLILKASINEGFVPYNSSEQQYLTKPLLKEDELEQLGNNIDFTLITPEMNNKKMIEEGKMLLEESNKLKNDLKTRYDTREKDIMNETEMLAKNMINSGLNGLEPSYNGEYYGDILRNSN